MRTFLLYSTSSLLHTNIPSTVRHPVTRPWKASPPSPPKPPRTSAPAKQLAPAPTHLPAHLAPLPRTAAALAVLVATFLLRLLSPALRSRLPTPHLDSAASPSSALVRLLSRRSPCYRRFQGCRIFGGTGCVERSSLLYTIFLTEGRLLLGHCLCGDRPEDEMAVGFLRAVTENRD